jgi:hypothetical protein
MSAVTTISNSEPNRSGPLPNSTALLSRRDFSRSARSFHFCSSDKRTDKVPSTGRRLGSRFRLIIRQWPLNYLVRASPTSRMLLGRLGWQINCSLELSIDSFTSS